jgi:hypothetical protein
MKVMWQKGELNSEPSVISDLHKKVLTLYWHGQHITQNLSCRILHRERNILGFLSVYGYARSVKILGANRIKDILKKKH